MAFEIRSLAQPNVRRLSHLVAALDEREAELFYERHGAQRALIEYWLPANDAAS